MHVKNNSFLDNKLRIYNNNSFIFKLLFTKEFQYQCCEPRPLPHQDLYSLLACLALSSYFDHFTCRHLLGVISLFYYKTYKKYILSIDENLTIGVQNHSLSSGTMLQRGKVLSTRFALLASRYILCAKMVIGFLNIQILLYALKHPTGLIEQRLN